MKACLDEINKIIESLMPQQHFYGVSVGVIDFEKKQWVSTQYYAGQFHEQKLYYDLASLTKPLTLATSFLVEPKLWDIKQLAWLLNHRASFPIGGRLSRKGWKDSVLQYIPVVNPIDVYSDFSALRLQLEIEKKLNGPLYEVVSSLWDKELISWLELTKSHDCLPTGFRKGWPIIGEVHDDNAFVIKEKLSHAGLFSTIEGVCQTLINIDQTHSLISHMKSCFEDDEGKDRRFVRGWDTATDIEKSLAGQGCSNQTFGHLGFTGTSIWIDCEKKKAHVILTNGTQNYWYDKEGLNALRRQIGQAVWRNS